MGSSARVLYDAPWALWLGGVMAGLYAALFVVAWTPPWDAGKVLLITTLCLVQRWTLLGATVLMISVDRRNGLLVLTYQSLLSKESVGIALNEIASIDIDAVWSDGRSDHVVISTRDGQMTPLRRYAMMDSEGIAEELRELIGVSGSRLLPDTGPDEILDRHEALISPYAKGHETSGVFWKIHGFSREDVPIARWFSPDFQMQNGFVYVLQKPASQSFPKGIFGERAMWKSLSFYGLGIWDMPGFGQTELAELNAELSPHFVAFAPCGCKTSSILNRSFTNALADWAARHPLYSVAAGYPVRQLAVLYSPRGVFVCSSYICLDSQLDDFITTGVQLVQAHQSTVAESAGPRCQPAG